jgi:tRNA(Glu) U13 pseudouridine synthase TruD
LHISFYVLLRGKCAVRLRPAGEALKAMLAEHGFTLPLDTKRWPKGSYRPMLVLPGDVSCETVHHSEPREELLLSDRAKLEGKMLAPTDGGLTALKLGFNLPSGAYATVVLRELMKRDTDYASLQRAGMASAREDREEQ